MYRTVAHYFLWVVRALVFGTTEMAKQNHKLGQQMQNLQINNKVIVVVAAPSSTTKTENAAIKKPTANYNKYKVKSVEGNASSNFQKPSGCPQDINTNKNKTHNYGAPKNVPKNTFHQQQGLNAKPQKPNGNAMKPQQHNRTNVKVSNQTNVQLGSNSKPINHGDHQRKNNNNQGTSKPRSSNQVPSRSHKTSNNSPIVIKVNQTNIVINR